MGADRSTLVLLTGWPGAGKSALAEVAAAGLGAPVLGWDWVMGALTPFELVQQALGEMDRPTYRAVGWSLLWSLAESQLRRGQPVVLDGVARAEEIARGRQLAASHDAGSVVVWCECSNAGVHQSRLVGRARNIPGWHELTWEPVGAARKSKTLERPDDVDLVLDATDDWDANVTRLRQSLGSPAGRS